MFQSAGKILLLRALSYTRNKIHKMIEMSLTRQTDYEYIILQEA